LSAESTAGVWAKAEAIAVHRAVDNLLIASQEYFDSKELEYGITQILKICH
jgi:hypothetical protein